MEETRALVSALRLLAAADPWRGHMPVPRPRPGDIIYFAGHVWRVGRRSMLGSIACPAIFVLLEAFVKPAACMIAFL